MHVNILSSHKFSFVVPGTTCVPRFCTLTVVVFVCVCHFVLDSIKLWIIAVNERLQQLGVQTVASTTSRLPITIFIFLFCHIFIDNFVNERTIEVWLVLRLSLAERIISLPVSIHHRLTASTKWCLSVLAHTHKHTRL